MKRSILALILALATVGTAGCGGGGGSPQQSPGLGY